MDARGAEHHDRVRHFFAPQAGERIEILGQNAQRPRSQAFHEFGILVGELRHRQVAGTLHEFPLSELSRGISAVQFTQTIRKQLF